jgi:hypothetical protein
MWGGLRELGHRFGGWQLHSVRDCMDGVHHTLDHVIAVPPLEAYQRLEELIVILLPVYLLVFL